MPVRTTADAACASRMSLSALTDRGPCREINEDAVLLWDLNKRAEVDGGTTPPVELADRAYLVAISDGMGGAAAGDVASSTALESLRRFVTDHFDPRLQQEPGELLDLLAAGVAAADTEMRELSRRDASLTGMGATLTTALIARSTALVAHVGDSRLYHYRAPHLRQLTVDHTFVQLLVARGQISPSEARTHAHRHLLVQALGSERPLKPDSVAAPLRCGDRLLLCTDGLSGPVAMDTISAILDAPKTASEQCHMLIEAAYEAGGDDNVTAVVLQAD